MMVVFRSTRRSGALPIIMFAALAAVAAASFPHGVNAATERPLMRFPDIHGDMIVFVYGEDIWEVPASGGTAVRLTIHDGEERFPKFSPDGKWIAFTGEYDGNVDIYVMNSDGGRIGRVTYHPGEDLMVGWHPTNGKIVFRSNRKSFQRFSRLFMISPDGTGLEELIMHEAAQGSFSPDGTKIAYNRIGRENRTWKRYRGGMAQDIYLFDFATMKDTRLTDFPGTDRIPMWIGDRIYFTSDRDRLLNIYSYDTKTGEIVQMTRHTDYDVRRPSEGSGKIVYEVGGTLWILDTATGESRQVPVRIGADAIEARPYIANVSEQIQGFDCSPGGERALVVARGEVFTVPKEHGSTRNLTNDSGSRDKDAAWSPDGSRIAYISDKSGEYEIWVVDAKGRGEPARMTSHNDGYRHTLRWSPDGKKIAFADQKLRCLILDVGSRAITEVDRAEYENIDVSLDLKPIYDFAWSPDSRHIAYSKMNADQVYQVHIYSLDEKKSRCVSGAIFNDFQPAFSRDGNYLFFVSNRRFDPTLCDFEWEMVYKDVAGIYCLTLRKDGTPLLSHRSDEVVVKEEKGKEKGGEDKKDAKVDAVRIDFDGLAGRIEALPLPRGNYRYLSTNESGLFFLNAGEGDFNRFEFRAIGPMDLHRYSFEDREEKTVIAGVDGYRLSADGEHVVYRRGDQLGIIGADETESEGKSVSLADLRMRIDPKKEWRQIFDESWRMERDFYYEPKMHGIEWNAMKEKYGVLMDFASCRQDVIYIVGELIGELNTSHTYVFGGDIRRRAERVNIGLLGVDWAADAGRYRFEKIFRVPDYTLEVFPPLARPGVDVREGDYLIAVNGIDVTAERNVLSYFIDLAEEQVTILVNDKPTTKGAREYVVEPVRNDYTLRYRDWVERNRMITDRESNGEIGYLHLPDTYLGSCREFPKYWYSQTRKKGLIVDGRFNGGGLDPFMFLHRINTQPFAYWTRRYSHEQTDPAIATRAHLVCVTNRQAGSGGDMLPMEFRMLEMGPIIGTRTWGGLVGVSMWLPMIDGGGLSAPDYRIYDPQGRWIVENEGITPDIEIDLDAVEVSRGYDAQLMKAIEVLKEKIESEPRPWPEHEPFKVDRP